MSKEAKLFSVGKVAIFLDSYTPGKEKRRDETVTIIKASFRVHPLDAKLAASIDDGLNAGVRALLFKLGSPEAKAIIGGADLNIDCPRQNMEIFAAPDTDKSSIVLLQVKIGKTIKAKEHKDVSGFALTFTGSFGPVDRDTLMFLQGWYGTQRFVSFEQAQPDLQFSEEEVEADEGEEDEAPEQPLLEKQDAEEAESAGVKAAKEKTDTRQRERGHRYPKPGRKAKAAKRAKR